MRNVLVALISLALSGCFNGERQVVIDADTKIGIFESEKPLASGTHATPTLQADAPHTLTLKAEGFEPQTLTFTPHTSGERVALYVVCCVLCPLALFRLPVSISCGEFNDFEPAAASVHMEPCKGSTAASPTQPAPAQPSLGEPAATEKRAPPPPRDTSTPTTPSTTRRFCTSCGAKLDEGKPFCAGCGAKQ